MTHNKNVDPIYGTHAELQGLAFSAPNGGVAFSSSRATSGNKGIVEVDIRTINAGTATLRFASEVNASAITITALIGYSKPVS